MPLLGETGSVEDLQVGHLRAAEGTSNQRVRYMFSGEIESAGKTNSPKNVPDPGLALRFPQSRPDPVIPLRAAVLNRAIGLIGEPDFDDSQALCRRAFMAA
jgi:hypothetical protein